MKWSETDSKNKITKSKITKLIIITKNTRRLTERIYVSQEVRG